MRKRAILPNSPSERETLFDPALEDVSTFLLTRPDFAVRTGEVIRRAFDEATMGARRGLFAISELNPTEKAYIGLRVQLLLQVRIPLKAISDSGGKPISIPEENRSGVGAKRRWHFDVAKTDRNRQVESVRSKAEEERR